MMSLMMVVMIKLIVMVMTENDYKDDDIEE